MGLDEVEGLSVLLCSFTTNVLKLWIKMLTAQYSRPNMSSMYRVHVGGSSKETSITNSASWSLSGTQRKRIRLEGSYVFKQEVSHSIYSRFQILRKQMDLSLFHYSYCD